MENKKSIRMQNKSVECRRSFAIPDEESVIQDYSCSEKGSMIGGHMYITQNYVCFQGKVPAKLLVIPFRKITKIEEEKVLITTYITIQSSEDRKYYFGSFVVWSHSKECLVLLRYLWNNPPSYVEIPKTEDISAEKSVQIQEETEEKEKNLEEKEDKELLNPFGGRCIGRSWDEEQSDDGNPFSSSRPLSGQISPSNRNQERPLSGQLSPSNRNQERPLSGQLSPSNKNQERPLSGQINPSNRNQERPLSGQVNTTSTNTTLTTPQSVQTTKPTVKVDVETSVQALKMLRETESMGIQSLQTLSVQAEQIDRIESGVENIHYNLDRASKLLRGIESLPAYIGNSITRGKEKKRIRSNPQDRSLVILKGKIPSLDIEILCKLPNDSLVEAILVLGEDNIQCIDPETEKLLSPEYFYRYSEVSQIVMRARPEHCDIRFKPQYKKQRFRLMSSYLQIIANELILRAQDGVPEIIFEEGVKKFTYNDIRISIQPPLSREQTAIASGFFRRENQIKTSALLENADQETKNDLDKVDANLDAMSQVLTSIGNIASTTGRELDRQNEQLSHINNRVDEANIKVAVSNLRIEKIIQDV